MKRLALAAALAAFTLPAMAGQADDLPGRNNPNAAATGHDATLAPGTPGPRVGPMAGDVPGRRAPAQAGAQITTASVPGSGSSGLDRAALGWDNDDYPGDH